MGEIITFEHFTIRRAEQRIYAAGTRLPVSSPGFRLLLALIDRPGELITKEALMKSVWNGAAVSENALHVHVAGLRKLIGNHLIITQSGVGYRFVGRVDGQLEPPPSPRLAPPRRAPRPRELIGRGALLKDLDKALRRDRFVTLVGPGGVGKTSLARAFLPIAEAHFPDGIWFVDLASLRDQAGLAETIKAALRIEGGFESSPLAELLARLRPQRALLILDNCEHLLPGIAELAAALFTGAPNLCLIATSRQPLFCAGEQVLGVLPLAVPPSDPHHIAQARKSAAYRLFIERIVSIDPTFTIADAQVPIAARICRSLDGLPLALEIVASWASALGLETLEEKLGLYAMSWQHASRTAPPRHHDLRTALAWSYHLLTAAEQTVLRRISVFTEAFSLEAAEHVAADEHFTTALIFTHLVSLVRKSLLTVTPGRRKPTYRLLETTRAYAQERLDEAGEHGCLRRKHADYLLHVVRQAESQWAGIDARDWLAAYAHLLADVRAALDWTIGKGEDLAAGVALAAASWPLWREMSLRIEGARLLGAASGAMPADTPAAVEAQLLHGLGMLHCDYQFNVARRAFEASAKLYAGLGDTARLGTVLISLAGALFLLGEAERASALAIEGRKLLAQGGSSRRWHASAFDLDLMTHLDEGRFAAAHVAGRQALAIWNILGAERAALTTRSNMMEVALCAGDLDGALSEGRLIAARLRGTPHVGTLAFVLTNVVAALVRLGEFAASLEAAREATRLMSGSRPIVALMDHLALGWAMRGEVAKAAIVAGFADNAYATYGWPRQHVEQIAANTLTTILLASLSPAGAHELARHGALLPESAALEMASCGCVAGPQLREGTPCS